MRRFVGALAFFSLAVGLAGCMSASQTARVDANIQVTLKTVCPVAENFHANYLAASVVIPKAAKYAKQENQAYQAIEVACVDPTAVNSGNIVGYVLAAYVAWTAAGLSPPAVH